MPVVVNGKVSQVYQPDTSRRPQSQSFFDLSVGARVEQDSNANRAANSDNETEELQYQTKVLLSGAYGEFGLSYLYANYHIYNEQFSEKSQPEDSRIEGIAGAKIGNAKSRFEAEFTHGSRTLLIDPARDSITSNRDSRDILDLSVVARTSPVTINNFEFELDASNIDYDEFDINDSNRLGAIFRFERSPNRTFSYGLSYSMYEINFNNDFDDANSADYEYTRSAIFFNRKLRNWNYAIAFGQYNTNIDINNNSMDFYGLASLTMSGRKMRLRINAQQDITDTSFGSSNSSFFLEQGGVDGRVGLQDQILRRSITMNYDYQVFCNRCSLAINLGWKEEDFSRFEAQSSTSLLSGLSLEYEAREKLFLTSSLFQRKFDFDKNASRESYKFLTGRLQLERKELRSRLNLGAFIENLQRESGQNEDYDSFSAGVFLEYKLF